MLPRINESLDDDFDEGLVSSAGVDNSSKEIKLFRVNGFYMRMHGCRLHCLDNAGYFPRGI